MAQNSNVVELYSRLTKSEHQLTYYNSGIGTYVKGSKIRAAFDTRGVQYVADLMFAMYVLFRNSAILYLSVSCHDWSSLLFVRRNFKEKVLKAYQWLSDNYELGATFVYTLAAFTAMYGQVSR